MSTAFVNFFSDMSMGVVIVIAVLGFMLLLSFLDR